MASDKRDSHIRLDLGFENRIHESILTSEQCESFWHSDWHDVVEIQHIGCTMNVGSCFNTSTKGIPTLLVLEFGIVILVFLDTAIEKCWCRLRSSSTCYRDSTTSSLGSLIDLIEW